LESRMASRKANELGLGDYYASDEEDEEQEENQSPVAKSDADAAQVGNQRQSPVNILGSYSEEDEDMPDASDREPTGRLMSSEPESRGLTPLSNPEGSISIAQSISLVDRQGVAAGAEGGGEGVAASTDPFSRLPAELRPPPPGSPDREILTRCEKIHAMQAQGRSFNDELRNHKGYRNPDLLTKLVEHWGIAQHGSALSKEVFDAEGRSDQDTIEAIMKQLEHQEEAKKKAREMRPGQPGAGIEFSRGTGSLGVLPAVSSASDLRKAGAVHTAPNYIAQQQAAMAVAAAAVANATKRSKWDSGKR